MKHKTLSTIIILFLVIGVLATIPGCGSKETQSSSSEVSISGSSTSGESEEPEEKPVITETPASSTDENIFVDGPYGRITLLVPEGWTAVSCPMGDERLWGGLYGILLAPEGVDGDALAVSYHQAFGVCGTGLEQNERTIAGDSASIGTYDNADLWNYIAFSGKNEGIVALMGSAEGWTSALQEEAIEIMNTLQFDKDQASGAVGFFERESEDSEIGVLVEAFDITDKEASLRFTNYEAPSSGELWYGSAFTLERKEGESWTELSPLIDMVFTEIAYIIPPGGESTETVNWETFYGSLSPGSYRIKKTVYYGDGATTKESILYAPFLLAGSTEETKEEQMLMLGGSNAHITIQNSESNSGGASSDAIDTQDIHAHYEELLLQDEDINRRIQVEDMSQLEMNSLADERFQLWETLLNELWKNVEASLPEGEVETFLAEKEAWISERETYATESANPYEGGSIQPLIYSEALTEMTKNKVEELLQAREQSE